MTLFDILQSCPPILFIGFESGGHSGRATPVPIPNTVDKPAHVPDCTEVREPLGTPDRCHTQPIIFLFSNIIPFGFG